MNIRVLVHKSVTLLLLLFTFRLALAALPPTFNYQGNLTDVNGVPVDGAVHITFRIYNTETAMTALWTDSQTITVNQGVFSIELGGSTSSPFPPGLFENPLWIGLSVGSDAEMLPRRPITSTGFAFKAGDANTLDGISASTLDQSAHLGDTANPHAVTAVQTGAADAGILDAHLSDTGNPHGITAPMVGAPTTTEFSSHITNASAHHPRYSDGEAVAAMGAKLDSNPLNHDRYSDGNAVTAMLASDGPGSTLDADLVDGLQASELIDAAMDEVRTPVGSLPHTISQSGSYYLSGNLDGSAGGIDITADDVTLDLMGFTIDGGGSINDFGIDFTNRNNVTILNGTVRGFGKAGLYQGNFSYHFATVKDVNALDNGTLDFSDLHSGIFLASNSRVVRCSAGNNGGIGISADTSSILIDNTAYSNGGQSGIRGGPHSIIKGNTAHSNAGQGITGSSSATLTGNTAYGNSSIGISAGSGSIITGNTAHNNTSTGISGGNGSTITGNTAYDNTGTGISGDNGSTLSYNTSYSNDGTYGIFGDDGANITGNSVFTNTGAYGIFGRYGTSMVGNTVHDNSNWGIYAFSSNLIKDNNIYSNNTSDVINQGGIHVSDDSRVNGNSLDGNRQNNIYVDGSSTVLKENHVTDSINGISFNTSGNYFIENTGRGNTTFINFNGTFQTDGGGNVSF